MRQAVEPVDCPECGPAGSIYQDGLASGFGDLAGHRVVTACRRAESLLLVLRRQFVLDVVYREEAPSNG